MFSSGFIYPCLPVFAQGFQLVQPAPMIVSPVLLGAQGVYMYTGGIIFPQTTFLGHAIAPGLNGPSYLWSNESPSSSEGSFSPASPPQTSQSPLSSQPSCSYTTPSPTGSVKMAPQEISKSPISLIKGRLPIFVQIHQKGLREKEPSARRRRRPRRPQGPTHYKTALCRYFAAEGICPKGKRCRFAHGFSELRVKKHRSQGFKS